MQVKIKRHIDFYNSEIAIVIEGTFIKGCKERGHSFEYGPQPSEPDKIDDVFVSFKDNDITFLFQEDDLNEFEAELLQEAREQLICDED